jgi:hypothetical protein
MMGSVQCFVGDQGGGKTLRCTMEAILAAQDGREVYMNYPLKPKFTEDFPEYAKHVHFLKDFYGFLQEREQEAEKGRIFREYEALFLVDEAQNVWNARTSMTTFQKMTTNYIFISRKIGLELHMATQLARNIDTRAKSLVQLWVVCTKQMIEGRANFVFDRYQPETGNLVTTGLSADAAEQFYPYYETTAPTSVGPLAPFLGGGFDEASETSRGLSVKTFNTQKEKIFDRLKELGVEVREMRKDLKKVMRKQSNKSNKGKQRKRSKHVKRRRRRITRRSWKR